jgi:hypothetical protein
MQMFWRKTATEQQRQARFGPETSCGLGTVRASGLSHIPTNCETKVTLEKGFQANDSATFALLLRLVVAFETIEKRRLPPNRCQSLNWLTHRGPAKRRPNQIERMTCLHKSLENPALTRTEKEQVCCAFRTRWRPSNEHFQ